MVETEAVAAFAPTTEDWTAAPWQKLERYAYRLQKRIYRAQQCGNVHRVHKLQRLLMKSEAARMLAVRRVTQTNQGKHTAGVDGVKSIGPAQRLLYVHLLRTPAAITPRPVRRVLIPKPGKAEVRPLGIPVLLDRAHQALVKLALEPQWEARFEPNSYGFRPGRSAHDAIEALATHLRAVDKFVLDADIRGCFDAIDHQALLRKLDAPPTIRRAVRAWLKAGVMWNGAFASTNRGTPQGGVISPLLANIALHGMEEVAARSYRGNAGHAHRPTRPALIRYADDFVVLHHDREGVEAARDALIPWLAAMGLQLHPTKTRLTHTLHDQEGHVGFDFLGFRIRQYPTSTIHSSHGSTGVPLGYRLRITPSPSAVTRHLADLNHRMRLHHTATHAEFIAALNPVIRGWCQYHRTVTSSAIFRACDHAVYSQLRSWARRRHPNKGVGWVVHAYWRFQKGDRWRFQTPDGSARLRRHTETRHRNHVKVAGTASPFDGRIRYWSTRLGPDHPMAGGRATRLLFLQHGRCTTCGRVFVDGAPLRETTHLVPVANGAERVSFPCVVHDQCRTLSTGLGAA